MKLCSMLGAVVLAVGFIALPLPAVAATSQLTVSEVRVNQSINPLGIDDPAPALSWKLTAPVNGANQSAYEIMVSSTAQKLDANEGDVWATGRVTSSNSVQVDYVGAALQSETRYYWKVRAWDQNGTASDWSAPAWWEMGMLHKADWAGASWISPHVDVVPFGWSDFVLDADFTIIKGAAGLIFRANGTQNYYMWQINMQLNNTVLFRPHVQVNGTFSILEQKDISAIIPMSEAFEQHHIKVEAIGSDITTWIDGVKIDTLTNTAFTMGGIGFRSGDGFEESAWANVKVSDPVSGQVFYQSDFSSGTGAPAFPNATIVNGALVISSGRVVLDGQTGPVPTGQSDSPLLRKQFSLSKPIASARAYAYGLGWYELHLNGTKVGDRELAPSASNFSSRNLYQTYDVTKQLVQGDNAVGFWLASGYGSEYSEWGWRWFGPRQAILVLDVHYTDGTSERITTDDSWTWGTSPVTSAGIYNGEHYDARLETAWDTAGFDAAHWGSVDTVPAPSSQLIADDSTPVRITQTIKPVKIYNPSNGVYVFDLGQNIAGWTRLNNIVGTSGSTVTLKHSEDIYANGSIDPRTNRAAMATDTYTLTGRAGGETWEPRFTYHGFRYVQVTGLATAPTLDTLSGRVVGADLETIGSFESDNAMLNRIYTNNRWTMRNNSMSFPTDTPVRDERTPAGMDLQAYEGAAIRDFLGDRYYAKFIDDIKGGGAGSPDMSGVHVPLAWNLYQEYGDLQVLRNTWPEIKARVDALIASHPDGLWTSSDGFGDWCPPLPSAQVNGGVGAPNIGGYTQCFSEQAIVNSALGYRAVMDGAQAAEVLGHADDAARYRENAQTVKAAFNAQFLNTDGSYGSGRQTTSILPLVFGMVPDDKLASVSSYFVNRVLTTDSGHLDTGIFGTRYLVDALTVAGRPDVALTVLGQTTYPGFGYQINTWDATTAWEEWPFQSGMETHDHAMFAGINASFLTQFGGILATAPGYETLQIKPVVTKTEALGQVTASIETVRGLVSSSWIRNKNGSLSMDVVVPVNSKAEIYVPLMTANHNSIRSPEGASYLREADGYAVFGVGSGSFRFVAPPGPYWVGVRPPRPPW